MNPATARTSARPPVVFRDAFGERRRIVAPNGSDTLDVLCLRGELTEVPSFEFALRERVSRLAGFRHPAFAQIRTVERLTDTARTLALICNAQAGVRISELLATAAKHGVVLDSDAALCLVRQMVTAMAAFHEQAPDAAYGALGPERVVVTPKGRLVIVEHVMGSAIEQLRFSEERYWRELRVPCPRAAGLPVIDQRADVLQMGMLALALLLGRSLNGDEFHSGLGDGVISARALSADGHAETLPPGLRPWLTSALQLDPQAEFASAIDALEELEKLFEKNQDLGASPALEAFLARCRERTELAGETAAPQVTVSPSVAPAPVVPEAVAPEPVARQIAEPWPEPKHAGAQEPLREEWSPPASIARQPAVREPVAITLPPSALPPEPPVRDAKLNRPLESARRPTPLHVPIPSHTTIPSHTSWPSHMAHLDTKDEDKELPDMPSRRIGGGRRAAVAGLLFLVLAGGGTMAARRYLDSAPVTTGTVVVTTNPPGVQVVLDGIPRGVSPMTMTVAAGTHLLQLRGAGERTVSLDVAAGAQLSQYIELAAGPPTAGGLQVRTDPAGARVSVDGVPRGASPVIVAYLSPGEHTVVIESEHGTTRQTVTIEPGATASLVANLVASQASTASSGGWISVSTPKTVQLFEDGRLLIVNDSLGYRSTRAVHVTAGEVSAIAVEFPKGTIALNAVPWADVWIDGEKVGETPIGNLPVTIGPHEVIFRHPDLGEQRELVTVTLTAPTRVSVDLTKKP